ncbi:MAG: glucose 1-dehydrogenase [Sulfuricaulis sp.]|nr:glucose 1-dehydrogenase [Sulfuricaulis sp.]
MGVEMFSLTGKVAVITGGGRGLGKAMALGLAAAGADVVVASRSQPELDSVADEIRSLGRKALAIATDVLSRESIQKLAAKTMDTFGKIDILVNNAGQGCYVPFLKISEEQWDQIIDVNLKGYFLCTQVLGQHMFKAKSGRVINISSAMASHPIRFIAPYAASKGAIDAMTRCLAQEWATRGITVNAIAPGYFATDMNKDAIVDEDISKLVMARTPVKRWAQPDELIGLVVYLASDASRFMTGAVLPIDGGWSAA